MCITTYCNVLISYLCLTFLIIILTNLWSGIAASNMRILLRVLQKLSVEGLEAKLNWKTLTYISLVLNTRETKCHDVEDGSPVTGQFQILTCGSTSKFESSYYRIKTDELPLCQLAWFMLV